jgi:alpha-glucosidase
LIVPVTLSSIPIFVRGGAFVFTQPVVQHTGETPASLNVELFPGGTSERWLYEDAGNGFEYQRGVFARRRFASRRETSGLVIEIGAAEGTYRPQPRSMLLIVRMQAGTVRDLPRVDDLDKAERGWTTKDGSLMIKLPDRFERVAIRIEDVLPR